MPLSLKMRAVLLMARLTGGKPLHELPVAEARQATALRIPKSRTSVPVASITNRALLGPAGDIPVRIYTPEGVRDVEQAPSGCNARPRCGRR